MNLKTSTKISIKFTIFTIIIVFLFWIFLNGVFLQRWHTPLKQTISNISTTNNDLPRLNNKWLFRDHFRNNITIKIWSMEHQLLNENIVIDHICNLSDKYFYFEEVWTNVVVLDITQQVEAQRNLMFTTLYLLILFWILAYFVSLYFVKSSLNKLNDLVDHVKDLNVDNLHTKIKITGPKDDEINILAIKMNTALDKIHKQTLSLKDFITNASHELKTPLMAINSEIDYAIKSKKHKEWLWNIKNEILSFNNLLDELVLITKIDSNINLDRKTKKISEIVLKNLKNISQSYVNKNIKIIKSIDSLNIKVHNNSFEIISKNLIENAFKYTNAGTIEIILNNKEFIVKDSWVWIEKRNLNKVWDRFWQEDSSKTEAKSFGLWLYLTKLLVDKHWRKIEVNSTKWKWSKFRIIF